MNVHLPKGALDGFEHIESALDRPIQVTRFPNRGAYQKREITLSLRELDKVIQQATAPDKDGLPWFKLATFGDSRTDKNCLRNDSNVLSVHGVEADYDIGIITPLEAKSRMEAAGIAGLIYTTPSHLQPDKGNRWRILSPLSSACTPSEREQYMRRLNGLFGGDLDPASFNLSQSYFAGSVRGRPAMQTHLVDGRFIDTAADLDSGALGKAAGASGTAGGLDGGSHALMRLAAHYRHLGRSKQDYIDAIPGNPAALAHVEKEARQSREHGERAIQRGWDRSKVESTADISFKFPLLDAPKPKFDPDIEELIGNGPIQTGWGRSLDDLDGSPSREYLVKGILSRGDVGCIFGAPGAGKSLIAPRVAFAVASGHPIFGRRTRAGKVFYVAAEDEHGMALRLKALRQLLGDEATENLRLAGCPHGLNKDSPDFARLLGAVAKERPALIVIDTLAMAFPGLDENDARSMGNVVHAARQLAKGGAAVLLIHHDTKEGSSTPRGHSVLNGALDMAVHVKPKDEAGIIRGRMTKNRNGSCEQDLAFTIGVASFGLDEDGDPIEAPFANVLEASKASKASDRVHLSAGAKAALQELSEMAGFNEASTVDEASWRKRCRDSGKVSADEDPRKRQQSVRRAIEVLVRAGRISLANGMVSLAISDRGQTCDAHHPVADDDDDPVGNGGAR